MAFNMQDDGDVLQEQHDINVTPFIDVMLVLLIIFMVAAPLATVSVPVNLPSVTASAPPPDQDPLYLTLQQDLTLTLGQNETLQSTALAQVLADKGVTEEQRILLRADSQVAYGEVVTVMNTLAGAGYQKIALVGLDAPKAKAP